MKRQRSFFFLSLVLTFLATGCELSQEKGLLNQGEKLQRDKKYQDSLSAYEKVMKGYPDSPYAVKAAEQGSMEALEEKKDLPQAEAFLRGWVSLAKNADDLKRALLILAEVQFEKRANYAAAIQTYNRLIDLPHTPREGFTYKLNLARANYFTNRFAQSLAELNDADSLAETEDEKFQAQLLRANVFLAQKKQGAAISVLEKLLDDFPDLSRRENVGLTLAVSKEEKGDLQGAVEVLKRIRSTYPMPEFIEKKIERLNERKSMQPGARGRKK